MIDTNEKLQHQLKIQKVREMKNPTILMNTKDFETFIKQVEAQVNNFKVGTKPTYEGMPISSTEYIEQGNIIIYDDFMRNYI
jgi:hypothetical protein